MDYTIIGGGVNVASRLESAAEPGEILIAYETYALVRDEIQCAERGEIEVKGIAYPVSTYSVIGNQDGADGRPEVIREDRRNLKLEVHLEAMTPDEREKAAAVLRSSLERLSQRD